MKQFFSKLLTRTSKSASTAPQEDVLSEYFSYLFHQANGKGSLISIHNSPFQLQTGFLTENLFTVEVFVGNQSRFSFLCKMTETGMEYESEQTIPELFLEIIREELVSHTSIA